MIFYKKTINLKEKVNLTIQENNDLLFQISKFKIGYPSQYKQFHSLQIFILLT